MSLKRVAQGDGFTGLPLQKQSIFNRGSPCNSVLSCGLVDIRVSVEFIHITPNGNCFGASLRPDMLD